MDSEIKELVTILLQSQTRLTERMIDLTQTVDGFVGSSNAYVAASNARMERMEANLDALIRAITAEHSNGKKK